MIGETVAYVEHIKCPSCGLESPGYLQVVGGGKGVAACPRCGSTITQALPPGYVSQIPPSDYHSPVHPHVHVSHYPGLYNQPKHAPRLDLTDLVRIFVSPTKAFASLYLTTNLERALALVVLFSVISASASTLFTLDMRDVLGYSAMDAFESSLQIFATWAVSMLAFLLFGLSAATIAKNFFGGRGERSSTMTLVGYCFPAYVALSIVFLLIFRVGFAGLDFTSIDDWTSSELDQSIIAGTILFIAVLIGLIWLLVVTSRAISVANDISFSEAALTAVLSTIVAAVVYVVVHMIVRLPLGLWL
ncbi:MAG: YIP1 family protein [Thermoplasmata archaeon]|jgi:hypothetical protein|nr:YIP1 family protein [Thermoplasmata archaeon]